jgi:hypothetical protein
MVSQPSFKTKEPKHTDETLIAPQPTFVLAGPMTDFPQVAPPHLRNPDFVQ